ncbi:Uncharacterised protein [Kluyvera cryocrescens]|uniref:Uncharacterized protein n=1 Tax=Kluyvera cryocrescens TaxID=580 RepID=A0A485ASW3_KLUCR|nr:Uncharacterised protein [Kluyvera cryocrescens]
MQWKVINGWYCVTACGLMSWKFLLSGRSHRVGIHQQSCGED